MTGALWLLPLLPLLMGSALAAGAALRLVPDAFATGVALTTALLVMGLAVAVAVGRPSVRTPLLPGGDLSLAVDGLSAVLVVTVAAVTLLVLSFSVAEAPTAGGQARFLGLMLVFTGAMLLTVTATTLVVLLASWELMGAMSYALIGYWWRDGERVQAANTAFLVTRTADLGQYVAAGAALAGAGSLALAALPGASSGWRDVLAAGLLVSALGKSAQLPFSFWISRAMAGPSPVSALLHSATMVAAGGYLLLRLRPLLDATGWAGPTAAWAGALTAVALGAVAVVQSDLKQLLAASTSAQIGFVVLAAGVGSTAGGTAQLVAHAAVKSALFLAAGAWLTSRGTKALRSLRGVAREDRVLGAASVLALLTLAGLPPLSLWLTKDSVLAAAREQSLPLYLTGLVGSVLSAAYAGRALVIVLGASHAADPRDLEQEPTGHVPRPVVLTVSVLAAAGALLGLQVLPAVFDRYRSALGGDSPLPSPVELVTSAVLAGAVVLVLQRRRGTLPAAESRRWQPLQEWLGLEAAASALVVRPVLALARQAARVDDGVLGGAVEGAARLTRRAGARAARTDVRGVDGAVSGVAAATRELGRLARRPQTGQLHQYYAQAAAVLVVLLLVVLIGR